MLLYVALVSCRSALIYKARLVSPGFQQSNGHNYEEAFAPAAHMTTVHTLVVVAAIRS